MNDLLAVGCQAARIGGQVLRDFQNKFTAKEKAPRDLVTDADITAQKEIETYLSTACPTHAFLGEESTAAARAEALASGRPVWVVDPLDGTANYVHKLQTYAVSIALVASGRIEVGVIYNPVDDKLYAAAADSPATCNDKPIRTSGCEKLDQAMIAASFPAGVRRDDPEVGEFLNVLEHCQSIRRLGSAALNLCYVAEGCLDGYWASSVQAWDVAAGVLIAERAGAVITAHSGAKFDLWNPKMIAA
ncbi:MAG: inositol monophosphatase family protein, partial [Pirellulales bacterium]